MIDSEIHPYLEKSFDRMARFLAGRGFDANMISVIGAAMMLPAFAALIFHVYPLALAFILLNRFCDGLDGIVAKHQKGGPTDFGGFLDIVLDYLFYSGTIFFFALGQPQMALAAAFLIFSMTSNGISFLALTVITEKRGKPSPEKKKKVLRYSGGLTEGFETIVLLISICLMPDAFVPMAIIFSVFCWIAAMVRLAQARHILAPVKASATAPTPAPAPASLGKKVAS
jgi:phosphatidylglycerophosphate synthase